MLFAFLHHSIPARASTSESFNLYFWIFFDLLVYDRHKATNDRRRIIEVDENELVDAALSLVKSLNRFHNRLDCRFFQVRLITDEV